MMINLAEVGAFPVVSAASLAIRFGLYLPGIQQTAGFKVVVRVIHRSDRFDPKVAPVNFNLTWTAGHPLDLWTGTLTLTPDPASHFGSEGTYLYRFQLWWMPPGGAQQLVTQWFTDPFARGTDVGDLAAVDVVRAPSAFVWHDAGYTTPELDALIVYELQVEQFNDTFDGVVDRLPYLQSLGVNCLELMPVTSIKLDFDWGYGPLHYFAPNARFGGGDGLRRLVDAYHQAGMAVILDVVYQHVDPSFAYCQVYRSLAGIPGAPTPSSPMIDGDGDFGPQIDFSLPFAQGYLATANQYWLDQYHVDGFRYDEVTDIYANSKGPSYPAQYRDLVAGTYNYSLKLSRFKAGPGAYSRVIQCAEALDKSPQVLRESYTNAAWQDALLNGAVAIASGAAPTADFAHILDPFFDGLYPGTTKVVDSAGAALDMPVAPFQYLNSHDHSHLIVATGVSGSGPFPGGNRGNIWQMQPLAIALLTSQGIPMLWEGEELCDNYNLPGDGSARINLRRDTNWPFFYDRYGSALVTVYRKAGQLRRTTRALRSRESFFYWQQSLAGNRMIAYHRHARATATDPEQYAMVVLNFSAASDEIQLPFPKAGTWTERLDNATPPQVITVATAGDVQAVSVPSNYGYVFVL
jgi:maltooligosyltrehalose trehalohydrolase